MMVSVNDQLKRAYRAEMATFDTTAELGRIYLRSLPARAWLRATGRTGRLERYERMMSLVKRAP